MSKSTNGSHGPAHLGNNPKEPLEKLLKRLGIPQSGPKRYDLLLIGDGSGCGWKAGCGWGCVSIERLLEHEPLVWYGAINRGTVNMAEMFAYVAPLTWYSAVVEKERKAGRGEFMRNVYIITDSQYLRDVGSSNETLVQKNGPLWQIFRIFQRNGLLLHWQWRPREDVALNTYVDALSKAARVCLEKHDPQKAVEQLPGGQTRPVHEYNPWT